MNVILAKTKVPFEKKGTFSLSERRRTSGAQILCHSYEELKIMSKSIKH